MNKPDVHRLGDLQLQILKVLWNRAEATVGDVHKSLCVETEFAYTTIATMLKKMEARRLVSHRVEERKFFYRAAVKEDEVGRRMSGRLVERLLEGSLADMVSHLLDSREVSRDELDRIEKMIAERRKTL